MPLVVEVMAPQPRAHLTLQNRMGRALEGSASLICGEAQRARFDVHNVGPVPITTFSLTVVIDV